ncbi:MAG: zinc-binding dehydrogenase [Suipraeoptans sp.]
MNGTMKTLVIDTSGKLHVKEVPVPSFGPKQALVKMVSCGICNGTDSKLIHQNFKGFTPDIYPVMLGHEGVGEVVAVGDDVVGYKKGDIVLLPFVDADRINYPGIISGWGAFSEYGVVTDKSAYSNLDEIPDCAYAQTIVPNHIDPVDSSMIITLREVLSAIYQFDIKPSHNVVIFGCGPVGQTFTKFLTLLGITNIIVFDIADEKAETAINNGAKHAFNSTKVDVISTVFDLYDGGADIVLDAVGISSIINIAMKLITDGGKICCYGISPVFNYDLNWEPAPYNWSLCFQQFPSKIEEGRVTNQIMEWLDMDKITLKDYISDYFEFDEILSAFEQLEKNAISKKGIVKF